MDPIRFGPFLKEERVARGLTQAQLAERLRVTPGAVSKWERGLCLPDMEKLEDLAEILQLSVLELLRCARDPELAEPVQEQIQVQVYRETLQTERELQRAKARRRHRTALLCLLAAAALGFFLYRFPVHHALRVWYPSYFETGELGLLLSRGSSRDLALAKETMALAEEAFSTVGISKAEAEERFGRLSCYCFNGDFFPEAVTEEHELRLWAAHFPREGGSVDGYSGHGYIWIYYSQEALDEEGELVSGSWRIPSLWRLERDEKGTWRVISIKEHP